MPPCSNCIRSERSCVVAPGHRRCSECTRRNSRCDACGPSAAEWEKLRKEEERLEAEEEAAAAQEQEAYARRMRLRKQQKALKLRGAEMLRRGLKSLDELEEAEERERRANESHAHLASPSATNSGGAASDPDSFEHVDPAVFSPSYWPNWGVDGGTPPATLGS